jgi:hypothetical protein
MIPSLLHLISVFYFSLGTRREGSCDPLGRATIRAITDVAARARHVLLHSHMWDPPLDCGDGGQTSGGYVLFVSSATASFFAIARISPNRVNAVSMQVLMPMKSTIDVSPADEGTTVREHVMFAPIGGTHGDGDGRSKYGVPCSEAKCEGCATTGIGAATHEDGDGETNAGAIESAAKEHAMAASVGGSNEDNDSRSSHDTAGSTAEHE